MRRIEELGGEGAATLCSIDDPLWQHMWTTVTLHKDKVAASRPLSGLFAWMDAQEGC